MDYRIDLADRLIDLCVDIFAHCDADYEITLGGNGTNPCEAANVAQAILKILGMHREDLSVKIDKRMQELIEEYE